MELRLTLQEITTAPIVVLLNLPACETLVKDPHGIESALAPAVTVTVTVIATPLAIPVAAPMALPASTMLHARANCDG